MTARMTAMLNLLVALLLLAGPALAKTIRVGPKGDFATLDHVPWDRLSPGDRVTVLPGIQQAVPATITARGTAAAPIVIAAEERAAPTLGNTFVFHRAAHVVIEGLTIEGAQDAAVKIIDGSEHITVRKMVIRRDGVGIWIGAEAGGSHLVTDNEIAESVGNGIAVDRIANPPGARPSSPGTASTAADGRGSPSSTAASSSRKTRSSRTGRTCPAPAGSSSMPAASGARRASPGWARATSSATTRSGAIATPRSTTATA
jgi:hypothetical protein